jgi:hypothetical protein
VPPRRCRHCRQLVEKGVRCTCRPHTGTAYNWSERQRRARVVLEHLEFYGPVCPGWQRPPHDVAATALTADHEVPVAAGGDPHGALGVLCRPCNSAKGAQLT